MAQGVAPSGAPKLPKWTVMVFMGAATIKGNEPLIDFAEKDLDEMRSVGSGEARDSDGKLRGELNIFVQVHQGEDVVPRRGCVTNDMPVGIDGLKIVPEDERDPARGRALECFIRWALETAEHKATNPDHYSMLIMWGHAYDFAMGRSQTRNGMVDALDFAELSRVLERLQAQYGGSNAKLDILGFDACDLATVEMACQLEPFGKYLLGSQIGIPLPGWPYDLILRRLREPIGTLMNPQECGTWIVRRFCESYTVESRTVSLTLLDLSRARELSGIAAVLALTLDNATGDPDTREQIASLFAQSQTAAGKPFVDVADLCLNLIRNSDDALVVEAARALGNFLISPRVLPSNSLRLLGPPLVIDHGRNAGQTARLNGISIYAPNVARERDFDAVRHLYQNFLFAQETRWSSVVHALARSS